MANPMRILVAYDGSECADAALDDLKRAGLPSNAWIKVLSVIESWLPLSRSMEILEDSENTREYQAMARLGRMRLGSMEMGWNVESMVCTGSPATMIIHKSEEWDADLIVVGSQGKTGLGPLVFGSVSQKVLSESRRPTRVGRSRIKKPGDPIRVLIGVDGSEGSEAAVEAVIRRVWPEGSESRIVCATWGTSPRLTSHRMVGKITEWIIEHKAKVQKMVDEDANRLSAAGLKVSTVVKEEEPKSLLIAEADEWGADCIFVGAQGMGRVERFLLGSVSSAVAARANCSVEVTR